ncbi:MAG: acyl-CoA dehydrogenase family protein [Syntrophales bacterium]|nr:acyl-CoA dehydrogenase family protein [Syntrophales bacterium]
MSHFLSEEQELMRKNIREFVETEVKPKAMVIDKTGEFPLDLFKRAGELGLIGICVSEEYGGLGQQVSMENVVMEEVAKELPALAVVIDAHLLGMRAIENYGTDEQKQKYLPRAATGETVLALNWTESAGSTNYPEFTSMGKWDGDDLVLDCTKIFITNSHVADVNVVQGMVDRKMEVALVEKGTPGLETGDIYHKLGLHGSYTGTVRFNNVRVTKDKIMAVKPGLSPARETLCFLNMAAIALGISEGAFEKTKQYVLTRTRFGKPLGSFQVVANHIAKMATKIELMRSLTYDAARRFEEGRCDIMLNFMAKAYSSEECIKITNQCIQLHGGVGYTEDTGIARYMRDAKVTTIGELPTDIHYDFIAILQGMPIKTTVFPYSKDIC